MATSGMSPRLRRSMRSMLHPIGPTYLNPQAIEVAPVSPDQAPLWHRTLPDTVNANAGTTFNIYTPALAPLADGDALVACALNGEVQLHRFDRDTGK